MRANTSNVALAILVGICIGPAAGARAAGGPEPGITLYGQVFAEDGSLRTSGRLTWTLTAMEDGAPVQVSVSTALSPFKDSPGTTFSYCIHIPAEAPVGAKPIGPNYLPVTDSMVMYERDATLDGAFTAIMDAPTTVAFGSAGRGNVERVNLLLGTYGPPGVPSLPSPANGQTLVPLAITLDWADAARTETYDLYLWPVVYSKPSVPMASGLTASQFRPPFLLRPDTLYAWEVVARNRLSTAAGAEWLFRTAYEGDLQKLLEFLLGKRVLSFEEQMSLDLNHDGKLDVADLILGLNFSATYLGQNRQLSENGPFPPTAEPDRLTAYPTRIAGAVPQTAPLVDQRTVVIGPSWAEPNRTVPVSLAIRIIPTVADVAGLNLSMEADPGIVEFVGVRAGWTNANEEVYSYSPYSGVMNAVFFAHPVAPLQADFRGVLWLDLKVTFPRPGMNTTVYLTKAALSDVNGVAGTNVTRSNGRIYSSGSFTSTRSWELYR